MPIILKAMKRFACLLLPVALLGACSAHKVWQPGEIYVSDGVKVRPLPLGAFKGELSAVQEISFSHGGVERTVTGVVTITPDRLQVIALAGMVRILTLDYTSAGMECDVSPLVPVPKIEPEYIVFDVQLAYFPVDAIDRALPRGMSFREEGATRALYRGEKKIASITRDGETVEFINFERSYSYKMGPPGGRGAAATSED
jgi:hypothetical protein